MPLVYKEVELHGFERPDTINVGTDHGDIPSGRATQLNLHYGADSVFVIPYRDGTPFGKVGYIVEGRPEGHEIVWWYREEICGLPADLTPPPVEEPAEQKVEVIEGDDTDTVH